MKIRIKNKTLALLATVSLGFNYGYSNYYVKSPNNIGSKSSITNLWGTVKSSDSQKYGWAMSSSTKSWNDVRLNAHWNYFKF